MPTLTPRAAETIAAELERQILEGSLRPGDRLPPERELAARLGVSRPPLREAIQLLAARGLVTTRHGVGTTVTDRLQARFVDSWQQMLALHPGLQHDMLEFRRMLEGQSARLAAERATAPDLDRMETAWQQLEASYEATADPTLNTDADVAFHQAIAEASHNAMIGHLTASILRVIHGHVDGNLQRLRADAPLWRQVRNQHRAIWTAIRRRDAAAAGRAAEAHMDFVRDSMAAAGQAQERQRAAERRLGRALA